MSDSGNPPRRKYDATGRRARAAESRERIVDSAAELFSERGYARTTFEQIAERAGVTAKLVAANGPKRGLLLAAVERTLGGVEGAGNEEARAEAAPILAIPDPATIVEVLADVIIATHLRGIGIWRALSAAAVEDPDVAGTFATIEAGRQRVFRFLIELLGERGILRSGDPDEQAATLALIMGFEPYQLMVLDWGWNDARLRAWTVGMLRTAIIEVSA